MISSGFQGAMMKGKMNIIPHKTKKNNCKCCGARNIVKGSVGRCEYCNSPI